MKAVIVLIAAAATTMAGCYESPGSFGSFRGEVQTQWLDDGRHMKLLADFAYVDPGLRRWEAGSGALVDGASIPQVFWSFIGGPFEGQHRNASIVHDVACQAKDSDWRAVHRMFYDASRCGGVNDLKATLMYAAVYHFGPRWGDDAESEPRWESDEDFERLLLVTIEEDFGADEIERLTPAILKERVPTLPGRRRSADLALPRFRRAFPSSQGEDIHRLGERDRLTLFVRNKEKKVTIARRIERMRASAESEILREESRIETQLNAQEDRKTRARLASEVLRLGRERAAVRRIDVEVRIGEAPPG